MNAIKDHGRSAAIGVVVIGFALTIAAWPSPSKASGSSQGDPVVAFKRCVREHGVSVDGAINPNSRSFTSARAACTPLLPGFARTEAQMLKVSRCMREYGISRFPNPTVSSPSDPARAVARSGVILAVPSSINVRSPAFKRAAGVCGFPPRGSYPLRGGGPFAAAGHAYSW